MQSYKFIHFGQTSAQLKQSFCELLPDPWLKEEDGIFRFRSYRKAVSNRRKDCYLLTDSHFYQSEHLNRYAGGITRKYPKIRTDIAEILLSQISSKLLPLLPDMPYDIGIHQIRISAEDRRPGHPAPEGIHQDGFSYIAIYCIATKNISGGDTTIIPCNDSNSNEPITFRLCEGDSAIFNDVNYMHYTSAIVPLLPGKGFRDVFIITFNCIPEHA